MIWDYPSVYRGLPSTADARFVGAVPQNTPASVTPGVEYYAGWFRIGNALTTGDHACEGCCTPVYLSLRFLRLDQPAGVGDLYIFPHTPTLAWQGAGGLCGPTPAQRRTWGQLKSLYR